MREKCVSCGVSFKCIKFESDFLSWTSGFTNIGKSSIRKHKGRHLSQQRKETAPFVTSDGGEPKNTPYLYWAATKDHAVFIES